jgi:hypothetical protein
MIESFKRDSWCPPGDLRYTLILPVETPSNNVIKGLHFHVYKHLRREWRLLVKSALRGQAVGEPLQHSFLRITRECAGCGLDWDNAYGGLKPLLDCLVAPSDRNPDGLGLIFDDSPRSMPFPPYVLQLSARKGEGRTIVEIFELKS